MADEERRRSIQDVIPPARSKPVRMNRQHQDEAPTQKTPPPPPRPPRDPLNPSGEAGEKKSFLPVLGIIVGVVVLVGVVFGAVSTLLHRANVSVTLNRFSSTVAETFEASPDGLLLSFSEREAEEKATRTVSSTGSESVEDRASGTVFVYNEFSTGNQRLITNTRFETSEGLVYRIKTPIVVPGYTTKNGERVPGVVEAVVYADEPGEKYNSGGASFTFPGLKGTAQFEKIYAKSKGALSGGFVGTKAVVDEEVLNDALTSLKEEAEQKAKAVLAQGVGDAEVLFPGTITVAFVEEPVATSGNGALLSVKGIARAPVFDGVKLARVIATEGNVNYEGALRIENPEELTVNIEPSAKEGNLSVTLSGEVRLVGVYDRNQLVADLAGKDRRSVGIVLSGYPAVSDMNISVYPFWRGRLPQDVHKILLSEKGEND